MLNLLILRHRSRRQGAPLRTRWCAFLYSHEVACGQPVAACIVYHNHPSGVQEPSQADELITERVKEALALIDVRLVDHILGGF